MKPHRLVLILICLVTLAIRLLPWHAVFAQGWVSFLEVDAYNQMMYAQKIAGMPFWSGLHFTLSHNLLWSGAVAALSHVAPLEVVGAMLPPLLAVGTVVLVYLIGVALWTRTAGLLAALFVSIIPSEFLHRSLVGFADHHAAEVFLMALVVFLLVKALKSGHETRKLMVASTLTLIALFFYLENWAGGLTFVGIVLLFALPALGWLAVTRQRLAPVAAGVILPVVGALALYAPFGGWNRIAGIFPHAQETVAALPVATQASIEGLRTFLAPISQRTIGEIMPLFYPFGRFDTGVVTTNLGLFAVTFFIGMAVLWKSRGERSIQFFFVWAAAILLMTLNTRRFLYYLTLPVGLASAYLISWAADRLKANRIIAVCSLAFPLILFAMPFTLRLGIGSYYQQSPEWHAALSWLKNQPAGVVTAWGDYGHWIQYETGMQPSLLPGPGGKDVATAFLTSDDAKAYGIFQMLGTRYVIVDAETLQAKLPALKIISGINPSDMDITLSHRMFYGGYVPNFVRLVYQSPILRIWEFSVVAASLP